MIFFALSLGCLCSLDSEKRNPVRSLPYSRHRLASLLLAADVDAVIVPFMLFYQASATAEKGITVKSLWAVWFE